MGTRTVQCAQCHVNNNYNLTSGYGLRICAPEGLPGNNQSEPRAGGLPADLPDLPQHGLVDAGEFRPHSTTGFPLTGAHASLQCAQCHVNGNYNLTSAYGLRQCHMKDFQGTTNPNHVRRGFPQTCQQCHNTATWTGATFDHSTTGFPLTGAHTNVQCVQCHVNNNYNLTSAIRPA